MACLCVYVRYEFWKQKLYWKNDEMKQKKEVKKKITFIMRFNELTCCPTSAHRLLLWDSRRCRRRRNTYHCLHIHENEKKNENLSYMHKPHAHQYTHSNELEEKKKLFIRPVWLTMGTQFEAKKQNHNSTQSEQFHKYTVNYHN